MIHTIYALLGMMMVTLLSLNTQRKALMSKTLIMRNEIEMQAVGVATQVPDEIAALPFDSNKYATHESELTSSSLFREQNNTYAAATDIDDVHDAVHNVTVGSLHGAIEYEVRPSVQYMRKVGQDYVPSTTPTFFKEVAVEIAGPLDRAIRIKRLFSHRPQ